MKFISLSFPLIILIECIVFVNFFQWQQQSVYEFEQRQQDIQVNYSCDAAVQEMLANGTHLDTDYATWRDMVLEPELALDTYLAVLIRNLGWADTAKNREDLIETSVPFFCVAVYDGYYMFMRQHEERTETLKNGQNVTNTVYEMRWTPKLPYSELEEYPAGSNKYKYYFYNLGTAFYGTYTEQGNLLKYNNALISSGDGYGTLARSKAVVNGRLTEACNSAMFTGLEGDVQTQWYLPSTFSEWSNSNPVESPSVLTYMSNPTQHTQYETVTFGIGGAKVDDAQFCICYTKNGEKLYTWADNRDKLIGVKIERVTTTPKEAAEAGYFFDITFRR